MALTGRINGRQQETIIQGEAKTLQFNLYEESTTLPADLTDTTLSVEFLNADSTLLTVAGVIAEAKAGTFDVAISTVQSAALKSGVNNVEVAITYLSGDVDIVQFPSRLNVKVQLLTA